MPLARDLRLAGIDEPDIETVGSAVWIYGEGRSCKIDQVDETQASCALHLGRTQIARGRLEQRELAAVIAAWLAPGATVAELVRRTPALRVSAHADVLERGEVARSSWLHLIDSARDGHLARSGLTPLLERIVTRPAITEFHAFTSMMWLCFSRSSHYPFVTDGLPVVTAVSDVGETPRFAIINGDELEHEGDAGEMTDTIERMLSQAPGRPFHGSAVDLICPRVDAELTRQGSALRSTVMQQGGSFNVGVQAGARRAVLDERRDPGDDGTWTVELSEPARIAQASLEVPGLPGAVTVMRRWVEDGLRPGAAQP